MGGIGRHDDKSVFCIPNGQQCGLTKTCRQGNGGIAVGIDQARSNETLCTSGVACGVLWLSDEHFALLIGRPK